MKTMIVGTVLESLLSSIFASPRDNEQERLAEQQKAAAQAAQYLARQKTAAKAAQEAYERLMRSYKQLEDAGNVGFKSISDTKLGFKSLDESPEELAAKARRPFDTASGFKAPPPPGPAGSATPFFGDTMPLADIQLLVNPEHDPRLVDLQMAKEFVVESLKNDGGKPADSIKQEASPEKAPTTPNVQECQRLHLKLSGFIKQREKFHKTVLQAQEQVTVWQAANRNALVNQAKDGMESFLGNYVDCLGKRGKAADRLRRIIEKNKADMVQAGANIAEIEAKIERLKILSTAADLSLMTKAGDAWQTFLKDGASSLMAQLSGTNQEVRAMMSDPGIQKYLTVEAPELNLLLDLSKIAAEAGVLGKWVARKVPIIGLVEISTKTLYNGTDYFLSLSRIMASNRINGEVLASAKSLQQQINDTYVDLRQCR